MTVSKTMGDFANDIKNNTVHMFKKLDKVIGGKRTGKDRLPDYMLGKNEADPFRYMVQGN